MRGRRPKPTLVKQLEGNPGRRPLPKGEPKPANPLEACPAYFTEDQKTLWFEALKESPKGLLTSVDATPLEAYCVWRDTFSKAAEELRSRGSVSTTVKGERKVAPEIQVMQKASLLMLKACTELGFTPSSRSRINLEAPEAPDNDFADV